jgi:TRAP-type C4-dicarboxylate transport system substrate-binding protein
MKKNILVKAILTLTLGAFVMSTGVVYAKDKPIIMRYAAMSPPKGVRSEAVKWWASEIEKRSKGAVEFKFFWSKALLKPKAAMEGIGLGTANIGAGWGIYHPAKTPLWTVGDVPFSHNDPYVGLQIFRELFKTYDPMIKELEKYNVKHLVPFSTGLSQIGMRKKATPVLVPDDAKGQKIRFAGGMWAKFWKACGAVPVKMTFAEVYEGLMRGTIDGSQCYIFTQEAYKLEDVIKHFTFIEAGQVCSYGIVINLDEWKALSPELKKIFTEVSDEFVEYYARTLQESNARIIKASKANDVTFYELTDEQKALWREKAAPFMQKWVDDMEAKGLPGKKTQELFLQLRDKYQKEIDENGYPWGG